MFDCEFLWQNRILGGKIEKEKGCSLGIGGECVIQTINEMLPLCKI